MSYTEIYSHLKGNSDAIVYAEKEFIFVKKEVFSEYKNFFTISKYTNFLNDWVNYKTREYFKHLHAVEYKNIVQIHIDTWNMDKNFLLLIFHIIFDILPHFVYNILTWQNALKKVTQRYEK